MEGFVRINIKVDSEWRDFWRSVYPAVIPAYHQNKEHWNTVILDGSVPAEELKRMIADSYDLVNDSPSKRIYEAVKKIPEGKVATYGQIPLTIPCHRVVNSKGELSGAFAFGGTDEQARRLQMEGVQIESNRVDLQRYGMSINGHPSDNMACP